MTGFITLSFQWLQEDYTRTIAQLLHDVVAQGTTALRSLIGLEDPFQVPTPAIWINTLWFLSLISSFGACLFGGCVKQWLRSYMQWTAYSERPRDLVAERQRRYEAFHDWKVPTIIVTIQVSLLCGLLEFLVGLAIMLIWQTTVIIAAFGVTAIAIVISLLVATVILPIIDPSSPYRSPISGAFIAIRKSCEEARRGSGTTLTVSARGCIYCMPAGPCTSACLCVQCW